MTGRGHGRLFEKGQSGNPGGRPKANRLVIALARQHTEEAIETLVKAMRSAKDPKVRCAAACAILDRAWGKPVATLQRTDYEMPPAALLPAPDEDVEIEPVEATSAEPDPSNGREKQEVETLNGALELPIPQ